MPEKNKWLLLEDIVLFSQEVGTTENYNLGKVMICITDYNEKPTEDTLGFIMNRKFSYTKSEENEKCWIKIL